MLTQQPVQSLHLVFEQQVIKEFRDIEKAICRLYRDLKQVFSHLSLYLIALLLRSEEGLQIQRPFLICLVQSLIKVRVNLIPSSFE